ncbi:MAG: S1-like domain-containing RNA-binding protein [Myxococcota bacterium]|nr:nucleic acid-binding protein [Deltaproteobacteria bacterium]MDQ3339568.1 S1-like domain-containing RNA-binding protein [Myxococcota bacterium]
MHGDPIVALLGRRTSLPIRRIVSPGALLAVDPLDPDPDADVILLPGAEVPRDAHIDDRIDVFVYLDSDDRPIATTREPVLELGQATFLEVTAVTPIGAFVDWGLAKELLVPYAEQSKELYVGEHQPIGLYLDKSRRLAGTMMVGDLLGLPPRRVARDEWIPGEAWRNDPEFGLFVILEKSFVGLVPASEPHRLQRGERAEFRVAHVQPDGKVVLSLRKHAHEELAADAEKIFRALSRPDAPRVGDRSDPELVRELFGLSKKAFKRAVGSLLKARRVTIDDSGCVVVRRPG